MEFSQGLKIYFWGAACHLLGIFFSCNENNFFLYFISMRKYFCLVYKVGVDLHLDTQNDVYVNHNYWN